MVQVDLDTEGSPIRDKEKIKKRKSPRVKFSEDVLTTTSLDADNL